MESTCRSWRGHEPFLRDRAACAIFSPMRAILLSRGRFSFSQYGLVISLNAWIAAWMPSAQATAMSLMTLPAQITALAGHHPLQPITTSQYVRSLKSRFASSGLTVKSAMNPAPSSGLRACAWLSCPPPQPDLFRGCLPKSGWFVQYGSPERLQKTDHRADHVVSRQQVERQKRRFYRTPRG